MMKLSEKIRACDFRAPAEVPDYEIGDTRDYSSVKFYRVDTNEAHHLADEIKALEDKIDDLKHLLEGSLHVRRS